MPIPVTLKQLYPDQFMEPKDVKAIPSKGYLVYILSVNGTAVVVGHGKKNRARVIFDGLNQTTVHFKAILVRIHHLYAPRGSTFERYLVICKDKNDAKLRENQLHGLIGGNSPQVCVNMAQQLFQGIQPASVSWILLKAALASSYDGISDLRKWRGLGIIDETTWGIITNKLGELEL